MQNAVITAVGHYVPERVVTNQDLEKLMDTSDAWITERSGIKERRHAEPGTRTSDLALSAIRNMMSRAGIEKLDVDLIIAATLSPDYYFPGIGVLIQQGLGLPTIPALDIRAQCCGFVYGLATANAFIRSGQAARILLVCAEVQSPVLDFSDRGRDLAVLFGDGAGAVLIDAATAKDAATFQNGERGVIDSILGGDGSGAEVLMMREPGSATAGFFQQNRPPGELPRPQMDGRTVFKNAVARMSATVTDLLKRNGLTAADIKMVFPHQANLRINEMIRKVLDLPEAKVFNNIQSTAIPLQQPFPWPFQKQQLQVWCSPGIWWLQWPLGRGLPGELI